MISLKKGFFALSFGIGMAVSLNAWAMPDCETCKWYQQQCADGVTMYCDFYNNFSCAMRYPQESCDA